jgi:hypothetical protein
MTMTAPDARPQLTAWVVDVIKRPLGSAATADAAEGATQLFVGDAHKFEPNGGFFQTGDHIVEYTEAVIDDAGQDYLTIGPVFDLPEAIATDQSIIAWDAEHQEPYSETKVYCEPVNGDSDADPIPAELTHSLNLTLPTGPRDGRGEQIVIQEDTPGSWRVVDLIAKAVTPAMVWGDPDNGPHLVLDESGIHGFIVDDVLTTADETVFKEMFRYDMETGEVTQIGEWGTNYPDNVGIFAYSILFQYAANKVVTRPVLQFNVQAGRDQPSIQADNVSATPKLILYSGASAAGREVEMFVSQGIFAVGIEETADDEIYAGAELILQRDVFFLHTDNIIGPNGTNQGVLFLEDDFTHVGYYAPSSGNFRGFQYLKSGDFARIYTSTKMDVVDTNAGTFKGINASAFTVNSDARKKTSPEKVTGALDALAGLTVYDYDPDDADLGRSRGLMAQEVREVVPHAVFDQELRNEDGTVEETMGVDLYAMLATTIAGLQEEREARLALEKELEQLKRGKS